MLVLMFLQLNDTPIVARQDEVQETSASTEQIAYIHVL